MVFLAISPTGLRNALRVAEKCEIPIWCSADAVSEEDYAAIKAKGVTRFAFDLGGRDEEKYEEALDTIEQHHPDATVWIEW